MANNIVRLPIDYFPDPTKGRPVFNGSVYIGNPDTDPEVLGNRKPVTLRQEDGTDVPVTGAGQPLVTGNGGVILYNGSPVQVLTNGNYSIKVLNAQGSQVYYVENALDGAPATLQQVVMKFDTLALAVASPDIYEGAQLSLAERTAGEGGGAMWDVVLTSSVTPNTFDIVISTGDALLSLVLRVNGIAYSKSFGLVGDDSANDTATMLNFRNYINANGVKGVFNPGTYTIDSSPNWAIDDLDLEFQNGVTIKHRSAATGYVMDFDGGAATTKIYNIRMTGRPNLDCVATSSGPFRSRSCHHSEFKYKVLGSPADCGMLNFAVASKYDVIASVNEGAFTSTPVDGVVLDERGTGESVADCDFDLIIEGVSGTGVVITKGTGNRFKGTSEGNGKGMSDTADARDNVFEEFWCEANATNDWELYGYGNHLISSKSLSSSANVELVTAVNTLFTGGYYRTINCQASSSDSVMVGIRTSDNASLGIKGVGTRKVLGCIETDTNDVKTGIAFGSLADSGTFTPVLEGGTTAGSSTYTTQQGTYHRIGNLIHFSIDLVLATLSGGSGIAIISGLPFASDSGIGVITVGKYSNIVLTGGRVDLQAEIPASSLFIRLYTSGFSSAVPSANTTIAEFSATSSITIGGAYVAA